jgi:hypothetical protein
MSESKELPPLVAYMKAETRETRSAAWLRLYAEKVRNGTASGFDIPNTIAQTIEDIAALLASSRPAAVSPTLSKRVADAKTTARNLRMIAANAVRSPAGGPKITGADLCNVAASIENLVSAIEEPASVSPKYEKDVDTAIRHNLVEAVKRYVAADELGEVQSLETLERPTQDVIAAAFRVALPLESELVAAVSPQPEEQIDIIKAKEAITALRDAARQGGLDFRQRDPLVMELHRAIDALEVLQLRAAKPEEQK